MVCIAALKTSVTILTEPRSKRTTKRLTFLIGLFVVALHSANGKKKTFNLGRGFWFF